MREIKFKEENDVAKMEVEIDSFKWAKKISKAFNEASQDVKEEDE